VGARKTVPSSKQEPGLQLTARYEYAATKTLELVWREHERLTEVQSTIEALTKEIEEVASRVEFLAMNPDLDDEGLGTMMHWQSYFGPEKRKYHSNADKEKLEVLIGVRRLSTDAQAGNVLQYAKLGLSLVHRAKNQCPNGRTIHGRSLLDVIWEGRNQAMHWNEGSLNQRVTACFNALAQVEPILGAFNSQNMAFEVIRLLGGRTFTDFDRDLLSLA
jgi:hypothetical protein